MKRILSAILILCFCIQLMPLNVFAAAGDHALKLELVKDTTTFAGKEVLRVDLLYKSGSDPVTDQMVNLRYDATKLAPLMIDGNDGSAYATDFSADWASLYTMNNYATPGPIPAVTTPSEVVFYTTIQNNVGYICWKVTEKGTAPAFADFTRVSSIFFGLKEGVTFTALPDDALTFSNIAEDSAVTNQVTAVAITSSSTSYVWGTTDSSDTLTVEPAVLSGEGVTIVSSAPLDPPQFGYIMVNGVEGTEFCRFVGETPSIRAMAYAGDTVTINYQWQQYKDEAWTDIDGATKNFYSPTLSEAGEFKYRVLVWNTKDGAASEKVESNAVILYVDAIAQLETVAIEASTTTPSVGTAVTLTAEPTFAAGHTCDDNCTSTYTWHKHVGGETFEKIPDATEASYTFTPTAAGEHKFYVEMTHVQKHTKNPDVEMEIVDKSEDAVVEASALPALTFTKDLSEKTLVVLNPSVAPSLTVEAKAPEGIEGTLSYQWYMNRNGEWQELQDGTKSSMTLDFSGLVYTEIAIKVEAIFTPTNSDIDPLVAVSKEQTVVIMVTELEPTVTVNDTAVWQDGSITLQPTIEDGVKNPMCLEYLERTARSYYWAKWIDDSEEWQFIGTTETCVPPTDTAGDVKCRLNVIDTYKVKDEYAVLDEIANRSAQSNAVEITATVTVVAKAETPIVTVTANKNPAVLGETVTLTATADVTDDGKLTYQWYYADGTAISGETQETLEVTSTVATTASYYVVVTNTKTVDGLDPETTTAKATSASVSVSFDEDAAFVAAKNALADITSVNAKYLDGAEEILAEVESLVNAAMTGITGVNATIENDTAAVDGDTFTVTVVLNNGLTEEDYPLPVTIIREENPSIKLVNDTLAKLDGQTPAPIQQTATTTQAAVEAAAKAWAIEQMGVNDNAVTLGDCTYTAPTAGNYATPNGTNGSLTFTVSYTATATDGEEYTGTSGQFTLTVTADPLTAQERVEAAMAELGDVVKGITLAQTTADDLTTDAAVKAALETKINTELSTYGVTATVAVTEFTTKPVAGSAATSREGTNGTVKYNVALSYDDANQVMEYLEKTITALRYTDVMDVDAYKAAIAALNALNASGSEAGKIYVDFNSTDAAIKTAAENTIKAALDSLTAKNEAQTDVPTTVYYTIGNAEIADDTKSIAVSVTVTKGSNSSQQTVTLTIVEGENPAIKIVADAMKALSELTFADVPYDQNMTQTTLVELVKGLAQDKIENAGVNLDVIVEPDGFKNAVPGTAANPTATQGSFTFKIEVTAGAVQVTDTTDPITFAIKAKDFDGLSDTDAVKYAEEAFTALLAAGKINQDKATTPEVAKNAIEFMLKTAIEKKANGKSIENLTLTVTVSDFVSAEAGSAATTKEGKDGSLKVTFSAQQGTKEYSDTQTLTIAAMRFNGVLDTEAVAAAKTALTGKTAIVPIRATEQQLLDAVQTFVNGYLTGNAAGVTATLAKSGEKTFTVTLTKGTETDTVTVNWKEADPIKLAAPANVVFEQGIAEWDAVDHAVSYLVTLYAGDATGEKLGEFPTADLLYDLSAELQKGQSYVVTVKAIADGVFYVNSDESTASEVYAIKNDSMYDNLWFWVLLKQYSQVYPISATAGEGGTISPAGRSEVQYKRNLTYTITPDEGYAIEAVWVDGENLGAIDTYTFKQVKGAHTIKVDFVKLGWDGPFTDVEPLADYAEAIRFVYENGYVDGVSETEFAPETAMTRADLVTALGKMIGVDTTYYMNAVFTDVAADAAYAPYAAWAVDAKLLSAKEDGSFGVNDSMTIEQAAAVLAQFAAYVGLSTDSEIALDDYTDADTIAESARAAMKWIVESGIYAGENDTLAPQTDVSRALIAEMLYRFSALVD